MGWPQQAQEHISLRLFVAGTTTRSQRAVSAIRKMFDEHLSDRCDLEIVDVYLNPEATRDFQIVATPTLVRSLPLPVRRIVGDLSDSAKIMKSLDIAPRGGSAEGLS